MNRSISTILSSLMLTATLFALPADRATAQGNRFLHQPSVGPTAIAFVHANDIWTVGHNGGVAKRITSHEGAETDPAFSPDGAWIAFSGEYGGNVDVYVVPAAGGQPTRLTW
ncbi:MAG: hypothetical protein OEZ37_13000, partial [Gemmatimonadota bacterium]|nr:hypothetical protein [Gemmatimonadota bacterium]